jgi:hypothetical protein
MKSIDKIIVASAAVIGGIILGKIIANTPEEKENYPLIGAMLGLFFGITIISTLEKDTVNYTLYKNGKRVYEGITFKKRLSQRLFEHTCDGKVFDKSKSTIPRVRSEASQIEMRRIKKFTPKYNVHHNC